MFDFYSDTRTKPTRAMREAVLSADVGDEQKGEDPTTSALCTRIADLLGKQAALFLPSGTMCNQIALQVHLNPGDEVICERTCHIVNAEAGGPAALAGAMIHAIDGDRGTLNADQVRSAIRRKSRHAPPSRLLSVEQTANLAGGAVWPLHRLKAVAGVAREAGLVTHMDGARLVNAVVRTGTSAAVWAADFDTVWIDFSKGLGAPVGAALAGSTAFIDKAWTIKQRLGGAMRQSGVLAAMGVYALDHHVDRLAEDHDRATRIAGRIAGLPGVDAVLPVETNIVIFDLRENAPDADTLVSHCLDDGLVVGAFGDRRIRVVTHLDVGDEAVEALCRSLDRHLG